MNKKDLVISVLATFSLTATLLMIFPTRSSPGEYDPWIDNNEDGIIDIYDAINFADTSFGTTGDPAKNVIVTNWPSQLLSNYYYFSDFFTLGPYGSIDYFTYRDFSVAGYRQVSIYVGYEWESIDIMRRVEIRIGMGDSFEHPAGYMWATYYNITLITTPPQYNASPFTQTIDIRGPQLTVELYNVENISMNVKVAVYVTC